MAVKICCIQNCNSRSTRSEDVGVTYHKFPREVSLCDTWIRVTRHNLTKTDTPVYVCSRHFCKTDFQVYKDSKYVLKSDAVPSIFPWVKKDPSSDNTNMESTSGVALDPLDSNKESEGDNLEAIKKFIEDQEKEFNDRDSNKDQDGKEDLIGDPKKEVDESKDFDERLEVASSMMDMILSESEEKIPCSKKTESASSVQNLNPSEKGSSSMALSVGSNVEAKDFSEQWYPAQIVEVDYEEMEVLVHYDNSSKKHDEWINVSSPRLRPVSISDSSTPAPVARKLSTPSGSSEPSGSSAQNPLVASSEPNTPNSRESLGPSGALAGTSMSADEPKATEEKPKLQFVVGERCLAKWRDNRRFMATVTKDLGDGHYEVAFDDGFQWKCTTGRMYKLKDPSKMDPLTVDTTSPSTASAQSPVLYGTGPSTALPVTPAFHTHLFDPTRDYLGSKSERREMKRKLNIKEIFNIGQKKPKNKDTPRPPLKKPRIIRRRIEPITTSKPKKEIPDAVASIIGTQAEAPIAPVASKPIQDVKEDIKPEIVKEVPTEDSQPAEEHLDESIDILEVKEKVNSDIKEDEKVEHADVSASDTSDSGKADSDPAQEEELKLEKFDKVDVKHEEVIDRMKEVINKLEDGINKAENASKPEPKVEIKEEIKEEIDTEKKVPKLKIKKGKKKLRLLQEKKVKKQVEKVKSELEVMKRQFEEMRVKMLQQTEQLSRPVMPESFLLPGEWCCRWINGQPVGRVIELEGEVRDGNSKPGLPRRSVQVEDKRLPPGWTKHMVRRSLGHSAGKWDVVLVGPDFRRFHTRTDMRNFLESAAGAEMRAHERVLMDFGVHMQLARRMGWVTVTPDGEVEMPAVHLPAGTLYSTSPLVKRRKLSLKRQLKDEKILNRAHKEAKKKKRKLAINIKMPKYLVKDSANPGEKSGHYESAPADLHVEPAFEAPPLEDGYVWVGSLKVQIIENLLRCPAEGCFKNFRNNTLLQMHIKHYHRELRKMLGRTPKVLDLAYARNSSMPPSKKKPKKRVSNLKTFKVKLPKLPKRNAEPKPEFIQEDCHRIAEDPRFPDLSSELPESPLKSEDTLPKVLDSPKLRKALVTKKRPRVLLPVRRLDSEMDSETEQEVMSETVVDMPIEPLDFETAISTHTVTKPFDLKKMKKGKVATLPPRSMSEDDDMYSMTSDFETQSSFPRSGTPDSKNMETNMQAVSSDPNEDQKEANTYMMTETGERIKIVHMKREEIINCHCGFREEDGLMVQCELCLCWQHALCHNIQKESEVPEKYTCSICLNPRRGRRSQRFLHDQDRLYEGLLPGARPCESLRRSHELSGNLHRIQDALHALTVKYYVATKKHHPKLYLWAKDWENGELTLTQEKLNSDYSDLSVMISGVGKENLPLKPEDHEPLADEHERYNQRDQLGTPTLLSGLLSSPGASLDLPISASELEKLVKTVQEEVQRVRAPEPEAVIENGACRARLLRHVTRCQAVLDARLDCIEAQVAELESQDPSFEDDETADYFPRTKQTIQMLMRDLDTMEELGVIT